MSKPILSIVVPTKDRYKYLKSLIDYVDGLGDEAIELVVEDNTADNAEVAEFVQGKRVKYFHDPAPRTITVNSDSAILHSKGKYVLYLGDDDSVLPNIMQAVELMEQHGAEALTTLRPLFAWSDTKGSIHWEKIYPHKLPRGTGEVRAIDPEAELVRLLKAGIFDLGQLPRVYHGIVRRDTLDKIYDRFGTFFPGPSPDMANAVALALLGAKTIYVDYPYIIAGVGKTRIAGNEQGDKQKSIKNLSFLDPKTESEWEKKIPLIWTGYTIYPQTALNVLRKFDRGDLVRKMNYVPMYYWFVCAYPEEWKMAVKKASAGDWFRFFGFGCAKIARKLRRKPTAPAVGDKITHTEYDDIKQYVQELKEEQNG